MNYKIIATTLLFGSLLSSTALAQEDVDRFTLCSRFPHNSKCKGFETPIPLKERTGEETSCQLLVGEHQDNSACKLKFADGDIVFYQEQGKKIEQIDNKRASIEYQIPQEQIVIFNHQAWGKINRWEVTYLEEEEENTQLNSVIFLTKGEISETIASNLQEISLQDSIDILASSSVAVPESQENPLLQELREEKACVDCDLQNVDLSGLDLSAVNLEGANLQGANLSGANLSFANLSGAYLVGANLNQANLTEANLGGTNFTLAQLVNANLGVSGLQAANFQGADLREANLQGAYLRAPAYLKEANLSGANLTEADLRGANLTQANLIGANLENANLKDTNVKLDDVPGNYNFGEAVLDQLIGFPVFGVSNSGVDFKTNLAGANLRGANLKGASLEEVSVVDANFDQADLTEAKLEETDLATAASSCGTTLPDGSTSDSPCGASSFQEVVTPDDEAEILENETEEFEEVEGSEKVSDDES